MSELLTVYVLSSNVRSCFFYLNESSLRNKKSNLQAIKIQFGENHTETAYASVSLTSMPEVPENCIGVAPLLASKWKLKEFESVLVSYCAVDSIHTAEISPVKEEDYIILLSCKSLLESHILNQVSVVAEEQILPLYVFNNLTIDIKIGKLNLQSKYGQLEKFTELVVLHSAEKTYTDTSKNLFNSGKQNIDFYFNQLQEVITSAPGRTNVRNEEMYLKHLIESDEINHFIYKIQPSFMCDWDIPEHLKRRLIIVSNFGNIKTYGPHCVKVLGKVKIFEKCKTGNEWENETAEKNSVTLNIYVLSLNCSLDMTAFCPSYVMEKLGLFVGSRIVIEPVKHTSSNSVSYKEPIRTYDKCCFWKSMEKIRDEIRQTVLNNIKFNFKINTMVVGEYGMGKTFLFNDVAQELGSEFIFCKIIRCKSMRGKKIDTLHKFFSDLMKTCCSQEPSVLILDDLHSLTYVDEEEGQFNKLFSNRIVDLITDIVTDFQRKYNISVIASTTNISKLSSFVSTYGSRLFQNVLTIPEITFDEKKFMLENIMFQKTKILGNNSINFDLILNQTSGYTIQDLNDLTDKAIFNHLLMNDSEEALVNFDQADFDLAISQLTPLNLRDVKIKENIDKKWEDIGGLTEPKKILNEVFSWPLEYPELLESCPLRLQRGVLLYGVPGVGKTLLAGALANKCGLNFISVKGPEVLSKYVGASEEGIRNLFVRAEKTKPCLLFFDEFDSLAPKRGHDNTGVTDRVVNQLLTQLDGVETLNGVWVLAATSRPDLLDVALLRPGRLDKMVFCDVPNQVDRLSILEALSRNLPKDHDVDLLDIAEKSEGYTGADLQAVLYNSQMLSFKEGRNNSEMNEELKINQKHLLEALSTTKPSLSIFERVRYEKLYEKFLSSRRKNQEKDYNEKQRVTFA